jgi:putative endonuclease
MFYVYMLKSISINSKKTYVGYTNDITQRLKKHNNNVGAKSTKGYKWEIIFKKKFLSKSLAMSFEYRLKNNKKLRRELLSKYESRN